MKRENAGSWDSGLEKEQILETYSAQLQKSWNSTEVIFGINNKYWAEEIPEGATHRPWGWGRALPSWARPPWLVGPLVALRCPSSAIWILLPWKKIIIKLSGRNSAATRRNLGGTNLGLQWSCSAGETSHREGKIITIIITIDPLIGRGSISINIFTSTISSQNPCSSLVSNLVSKPQIGTCGLLVVLITPCSWC